MACQMGSMNLPSKLSITENEGSKRSFIHSCCCQPRFSALTPNVGMKPLPFLQSRFLRRRPGWTVALALNTDGLSGNGEQQSLNDSGSSLGGTRLGRILSAGGRQLLDKLNSARKNFPTKVFLLLLGFYTANALATILGQTGDWDVLVAGVVVAAIEGIGMLIYKKPPTTRTGRLQSFLVMVNYWKAGICLGLFVDAFKLGS